MSICFLTYLLIFACQVGWLCASSELKRFNDLNVVCIGCSQGIGKATVQYLSLNGANVVACSRTLSKFEWIPQDHPNIHITTCDAGNIESISNLLTFSLSKLDSITGIVYIPTGFSQYFVPFHIANLSEILNGFDVQSSVDYKGYISTVRIFFDELSKTGIGSVISISSIASQIPTYTTSNFMHYGAIKSAQDYVMKSLAKSYAHIPIRFNSVTPGYIKSNAFDGFEDELKNQVLRDGAIRSPMLRVGSCDEVGKTISFLLSKEASYITGIELKVDGGTELSNSIDGAFEFVLNIPGVPDAWHKMIPNDKFDLDSKKLKNNHQSSTKQDL